MAELQLAEKALMPKTAVNELQQLAIRGDDCALSADANVAMLQSLILPTLTCELGEDK